MADLIPWDDVFTTSVPKSAPKPFPKPFRRQKTHAERLETLPTSREQARGMVRGLKRAEATEIWRALEQAEMRKEAETVAGEWVTTISGVALFVTAPMLVRARAAQATLLGKDRRAA
jgi:hypothetical protein